MKAIDSRLSTDLDLKVNTRLDVISLGVAFVQEVTKLNLQPEETRGLLTLIEKLLHKSNLL